MSSRLKSTLALHNSNEERLYKSGMCKALNGQIVTINEAYRINSAYLEKNKLMCAEKRKNLSYNDERKT